LLKWLVSLFKTNQREVKIEESISNDAEKIMERQIDKNIRNKQIEEKINYEVINYQEGLQTQIITWNTSYSYTFEKEKIEGYEVLREERIVGCYYRQENIDEVIETLKNTDGLKFKLIAEADLYNAYDYNAKKVSIIYLVENETRKIHLGYLSRETALELKDYEDIKVSLVKIENIDYKDTNLAIYLKSEVVQEVKEKKKKLEEERKRIEQEMKLKEINWNIAFETNQLAMTLEKMGRVEEAKEKYIEAIKLGFDGSYAFDRLNILYRKEKDYEREIDNCKQAIKLFEDLVIVCRVDAEGKLNKYKERLKRATELNQKQLNRKIAIEEKTKAKEENIKMKQLEKEEAEREKLKAYENNKKVVVDNQGNILRVCTICNIEKTINEFERSGTDSRGNIKYKHQCKLCRNELRRKKKENLE